MKKAVSGRDLRRWALARQIARVDRRLSHLRLLSERLGWARLLVFVVGFVSSAALFFFEGPLVWLASLLLWLIPFALIVAYHRRIERGIQRHALWRDLREAHLARMDLDWARLPEEMQLPPPPKSHPFALDLDIYGQRSIQRLIDTAVSYDGSLRLRQQLLDVDPTPEKVHERQALVSALRPLSLFRDRLALRALLARGEDGKPWKAERLLSWVQSGVSGDGGRSLRRWVWGLALLGIINVALMALSLWLQAPAYWVGGLGLYFALMMVQGRAASNLFKEAMALQDVLQQVAAVFSRLERPRFQEVQPLRKLCAPFRGQSRPPSDYLRRLGRLVAAAGLSRNPVLWLALNAFFPWDLFFAYRLQGLRTAISQKLPEWLDVWFELEAASSLANLAYLNPAYTFPRVTTSLSASPPFVARAMGHPLIVHEQKVCNDFSISDLGSVILVTGSNMSGKSSFLRTVGVNLCLAYAGGAVNASEMDTGLFRLFSAIRVTDSVTDGISYFYAEVKRLRALLDALKDDDPRPLFFLIDEIFRGTNNRERLLGSRAYIRELVGENGVGLIATHDLELVHLAEEMTHVSNFHFRDSIHQGRMVFDYHLRPGPSPTTNALVVMAEEGLPVPKDINDPD